MSWTARSYTIPPIAELVVYDAAKREINLGVIVVGSFASAALHHLLEATAPPAEGGARFIDATRPGEASLDYLPLRLGDIRGFSTRLHLYGLGEDPRLVELAAAQTAWARGVIVAQREPGPPRPVVATVRDSLGRRSPPLPVALLGDATLSRAWREGAGEPVLVQEAATEAIFPALKALSREMLSALRSG